MRRPLFAHYQAQQYQLPSGLAVPRWSLPELPFFLLRYLPRQRVKVVSLISLNVRMGSPDAGYNVPDIEGMIWERLWSWDSESNMYEMSSRQPRYAARKPSAMRSAQKLLQEQEGGSQSRVDLENDQAISRLFGLPVGPSARIVDGVPMASELDILRLRVDLAVAERQVNTVLANANRLMRLLKEGKPK